MPGSWAMVVTDEEEGLRFTPGSGAVLGTQMSPQEALDVRIYRLVCLANWLRSEMAKMAAKEMAGAAKRKYMVESPWLWCALWRFCKYCLHDGCQTQGIAGLVQITAFSGVFEGDGITGAKRRAVVGRVAIPELCPLWANGFS